MVTINRKFTCTVPIPNNWTGDKFRCREIPSIDPEKRPKTLVSTISSNFFSFLICTVVCRGIENPTEWNHTYLCFITFAKRFFLLFFISPPIFILLFSLTQFSLLFFVHGHDCARQQCSLRRTASSSSFSRYLFWLALHLNDCCCCCCCRIDIIDIHQQHQQ